MNTKIRFASAALATLSLFAPTARAGGISIGISGHGHNGSFGVWLGDGGFGSRPAPCAPRTWCEGRWVTVTDNVWVEGGTERVWIEPLFDTRYDPCGRPYQACLRAGYWNTVCRSGHYERRTRQVFEEGHWNHPAY